MNLHNDKDAFRALLLDIERKTGIRMAAGMGMQLKLEFVPKTVR